ncbi:hypothetical protein ABPG74_003017 [Tetrahymena malaccensis]
MMAKYQLLACQKKSNKNALLFFFCQMQINQQINQFVYLFVYIYSSVAPNLAFIERYNICFLLLVSVENLLSKLLTNLLKKKYAIFVKERAKQEQLVLINQRLQNELKQICFIKYNKKINKTIKLDGD